MEKLIEKYSKWFLEQKPIKIFLLCMLLGLPFYLWMFSIVYQLDIKQNNKRNKWKEFLLYFSTFYPLFYVFIFILFMINILFSNDANSIFSIILPFHFLAMLCSLILMIMCAKSYTKFEKSNQINTSGAFVNFILIAYYIVGIWIFQPKLNNYIEMIKSKN
ncbi:MAG: hypothetical protein GX159_09195 [Flavobacteriaceae bacterium]|nr:hypothetical protein [Flavobacteriaceae bacterium]